MLFTITYLINMMTQTERDLYEEIQILMRWLEDDFKQLEIKLKETLELIN